MKMSSQEIKAYNWTFVTPWNINLNLKDNNLQYIIGLSKTSFNQGFIQLKCKGDKNDVKRILGGDHRLIVTNVLIQVEQVIE